jgi:hypothetical protein
MALEGIVGSALLFIRYVLERRGTRAVSLETTVASIATASPPLQAGRNA